MGNTESNDTNTKQKNEETKLLYIDDLEITHADWGSEGIFTYLKRMCGLEGDSENELRKKQQKFVTFVPGLLTNHGVESINVFLHQKLDTEAYDAIYRLQQFFRSYLIRNLWKKMVYRIVDRFREEKIKEEEKEDYEEIKSSFCELLLNGFPAMKLTSRGKWKHIALQVILNPDKDDCYLTWKPAKLPPQLKLEELENVYIPSRNSTSIPSYIIDTMSFRKSIIISHPSVTNGEMILQLCSTKERDILYHGFKALIAHIRCADGQFDTLGILRKQTKIQCLLFFNEEAGLRRLNELRNNAIRSLHTDDSIASIDSGNEVPVANYPNTDDISDIPVIQEQPSVNLEKFYNTRFDEDPNILDQSNTMGLQNQLIIEEEEAFETLFSKRYSELAYERRKHDVFKQY